MGWVWGIGSGPESSRAGVWACSWLAGTRGDGQQTAGALEESDIDPRDSPSGPCKEGFGLGMGYRIGPYLLSGSTLSHNIQRRRRSIL